ncbi:MAG: hypothetical protein V4456_12555 [Bacteroidota bacterium]
MEKLNLNNYWGVLEIPRIDDKQIVYTFKFWNDAWGQVIFNDLKDGKEYEGKFFLVRDDESSETLIHFNCDDCAFFNPMNPNDDQTEQVLGFDEFIDKFTTPYELDTMRKN